jgi:hypothetical protein
MASSLKLIFLTEDAGQAQDEYQAIDVAFQDDPSRMMLLTTPGESLLSPTPF